jgi:DNA-binding Lrp family transcriptional regulator
MTSKRNPRGPKSSAQTPVTRSTLLPVDWRLLERLASYGPNGIWPGIPKLAADLGVSDRTVQRSLRRLKAAGRIEIIPTFEDPYDGNWTRRERRIRHLGAQATNTYRLSPGPQLPATNDAVASRCEQHRVPLVHLVPGRVYCPLCHQVEMNARGLGNYPIRVTPPVTGRLTGFLSKPQLRPR